VRLKAEAFGFRLGEPERLRQVAGAEASLSLDHAEASAWSSNSSEGPLQLMTFNLT